MLRQLWNDESGALISAELVMLGTVMVVGTVTGMSAVRDAVITELGDFASAISNLDQSLVIHSVTGHAASTAGTSFLDTVDANQTLSVSTSGGGGGSASCTLVLAAVTGGGGVELPGNEGQGM